MAIVNIYRWHTVFKWSVGYTICTLYTFNANVETSYIDSWGTDFEVCRGMNKGWKKAKKSIVGVNPEETT